ncbi:dihydrolipoamide acetyltransferase family protein [Sulfuritalea hydrogenivorans]|uniref:Dihydrolipoamide acetyltransferase component of pyruvate dehydrogenase complex n=1 Tax=Sulfuritalea hydrogenivorans sk43H TaxID=1223802 RepID=W0SHC6_9PROT|nr:dihydrolipoamide acetyltransferase family protein [Sulfuritalea hydrogenivorans]MDK9714833.1 2-oxo acid dehydrogenase subunit E2 [Sulfuritalea sp.]BAO30759.1 branched-chain alpha-keto acid dehydrogenase E2 subunit [Sulfuritalea hydrogenivorans sk43H]
MIEFKLPSLGADMDEGTLLEWKVGVGDTVKKGQVVAIVDTSKAAVDVESWQEGTVHQLIAEIGQKMPVGTVMALLLQAGETAPAEVGAGATAKPMPKAAPAMAAAVSAAATAAAPVAASRRMISPAARKHAEEKGVDLDRIAGTGPHGAVTLEDVENAAAAKPPAAAAPAAKPADRAPDRTADMRKTIAAAMSRSKREIPHYYVAEDIPLAKALAWLQSTNAQRSMAERLLPAVLLLKAVAVALKRYPELNGYFRDGGFVPIAAIHLGVAISLRQGGLIAPALLDADGKPLTQLMQGLTDLVKRTRAGSLRSSEMNEATITVTNLGDQGSQSVFGVITPPQVALVGFGRVAERPWAEDGGLKVLPVVTASLSADHRVSDGHRGALFLRELNDLLQRPEELDR